MDNNQKHFNLYVFFSTFAKNLVEVFIPIILYKFGYSLNEVILYYLICNIGALIFMFPCIYISNKYSNKILCFIGIVCFTIVQIMLANIEYSYIYLVSLGLVYALYRRGYWISRRYYNLKIMHKTDISKSYSIICIVNQASIIISAYIGSLLLDFINIKVLTIISIIVFLLSLIPLYKLKFRHEISNTKVNLIKTLKTISFNNLYLFGTYELTTVVNFLIPLYLFIYVKNNYQTIGILNLLVNLATIVFAYLYGKKINGDKNYLKLSILGVVLVFALKINITNYLLIIISLFQGVFTKMHEISISKEFYTLSKKFEYQNYNVAYEFTQNLFRTIAVLILYLFISDLHLMIYALLFVMLTGSFLKFKKIDITDYSSGQK